MPACALPKKGCIVSCLTSVLEGPYHRLGGNYMSLFWDLSLIAYVSLSVLFIYELDFGDVALGLLQWCWFSEPLRKKLHILLDVCFEFEAELNYIYALGTSV